MGVRYEGREGREGRGREGRVEKGSVVCER